MFRLVTVLAALTLASTLTSALAGTPNSFEDDMALAHWEASSASELTVTDELGKSGSHSLHWSWSLIGQTLTYRHPAAFAGLTAGDQTGSCLGFWLYNEAAIQKPLRAELLDADNRVVAWFWFWMDFQGWRPLVIRYSQMVGWEESQTIHAVRFFATDDILFGQLFIDHFDPHFVHAGPVRSHSTPWVGEADGKRRHPQVMLSSNDITLNRPWLPAKDNKFFILKEEIRDLDMLQRTALPPLPPQAFTGDADAATVAALRERLAAWNIQRNSQGWMTGRPVDRSSILKPDDAVDIGDYMELVAAVKTACEQAASDDLAAELRQMFIDLTEHLLTQGYDEGAANMGNLGSGDDVREWPHPFYAMRDVLGKAGLRRRMALAIFDHFGAGSSALREQPGATMDTLANYNRALLPSAMMLPDKIERLQRLRVIRRYYNQVLTNPEVLGPDGSAFPHGMHHRTDTAYSLKHPIQLASLLAGTQFDLSETAHERLRTYIRATDFATIGGQQPPNLSTRAGAPLDSNAGPLADHLGLELPPPSGHWTMNGARASLHRRDDWLASIVGMTSIWRGLEVHNYGRYAHNGSVLVTRGSPAANGFDLNGWNWSQWPGTTSLLRPSHELLPGHRETSIPGGLAGGASLGANGIWGAVGTGPDVAFHKSVFCFDNRLTVVTTDISSTEPRPAITTLFQAAIDSASSIHVDGEAVTAFPAYQELSGSQPHWLVDAHANGYYIHAGSDTLHLARHRQQWTYMTEAHLLDKAKNPILSNSEKRYKHDDMKQNETYFKPTAGDFTVAWFDHGEEPSSAAGIYTIVIAAGADRMADFATSMTSSQPPYRLLRHDSAAHILHDTASDTTGYVLTAANDSLPADGLLVRNSRPCYVMIHADERQVQLSVAGNEPDNDAPITLELRGNWKLDSGPAGTRLSTAADTTTVTIPWDDAMPDRLVLGKGGWWPF